MIEGLNRTFLDITGKDVSPEAFFGPYRKPYEDEEFDPSHAEEIDGVVLIPSRLYRRTENGSHGFYDSQSITIVTNSEES